MTPADVLGALVRVNLATAAAILIVIALRKPARSAFGARAAYGLWLLPTLASAAVLAPARRIAAPAAFMPATARPLHPALISLTPSGSNPDLSALLVCLWLTGVLGAGLILAYLQFRFARAARQGLAGPAIVGLIRPTIVTPSDFAARFSADEQDLILTHEQTHIARHDSRVNGLCCIAQCLSWFNPLIHLAARLVRIDQELACDETVATRFPEARRAYAQVLVKAQLAVRPLPLGCNWLSGSEHPLLERIAMLKLRAVSPTRRLVGASAIAIFCSGASFAAWAVQPAELEADAVAAHSAQAQPTPPGPIDVMANDYKVMPRKNRGIWTGDVSTVFGSGRLMADSLTTNVGYINKNGSPSPLGSLVANGHVLYVSAGGAVRAERAVYEPERRTLTLSGNVVAVQGQKEVRAQTLVIDLTR